MSEIYKPTQQESLNLRTKDDFLKVSGDGIFVTRQGEGVTAGKDAVFIRLHFCNLACGRDGSWKCDTGYTWDKRDPRFWQEPYDLKISTAATLIKDSWKELDAERRLVVTGGEPMLQQKKIAELLKNLPGWTVEIETNGTIIPIADLSNCQFNCSPKLSNSGNTLGRRYRPDVLRAIATLPNSWFKFVVTCPKDIQEIEKMVSECGILPEKVLIMPEGQTAETVADGAWMIKELVIQKGWKLTMRNQLIWYGPKRRT
jgi:organic radical activating enzyme